MADRYVYSGAGGAGTGADWANAHTTLSAAITAAAAGDVYYVAHDHAANYGVTTTLTFKGTAAAPDRVLCVDRAGSVPPVAADLMTGAAEGTNAASTSLVLAGNFYCHGMTWAPGSGQSTTGSITINNASDRQSFTQCVFSLLSSGGLSTILFGGVSNSGGRNTFKDCNVRFAATGQGTQLSGCFNEWVGPSAASILAAGSSVPTNFIEALNNNGMLTFSGADLSAISGTLVVADELAYSVRFLNCELHATVTVSGVPTGLRAAGVEKIGSGPSGNVASNERYWYQGTLTTETTIIRTGGASDGTTAYSWKIVPTANNERDFPFETGGDFEGKIWNEDIGSPLTLTVHCLTDNVTLTDAEIWLEVEYLGSSATPVSTLITDAPATVLTAGANQATSTEAWTTTGLTTPVYQKLEVTFTPQMVGLIRWRVKYAKASTTVYVCPKAEVS